MSDAGSHNSTAGLPLGMPLAFLAGMEFFWIAALTLWTLLIGPIMDGPRHERTGAKAGATSHSSARR